MFGHLTSPAHIEALDKTGDGMHWSGGRRQRDVMVRQGQGCWEIGVLLVTELESFGSFFGWELAVC